MLGQNLRDHQPALQKKVYIIEFERKFFRRVAVRACKNCICQDTSFWEQISFCYFFHFFLFFRWFQTTNQVDVYFIFSNKRKQTTKYNVRTETFQLFFDFSFQHFYN